MSGHSKWANIKNRKGAVDKKRSETFTKLAKLIITAVSRGGGVEPESNHQLKAAIEKAREANMPKENIDRLLSNFAQRQQNLSKMTLEGFASGGVPLIIELQTDNKNRSLAEIRLIVKNYGGSLGEVGSVVYLFERLTEMQAERELTEEEQLELIDLGVTEIDGKSVYFSQEYLAPVKEKLISFGMSIVSTEVVMRVKRPVLISDEEEAGKIADLVEELEDHQDVLAVYLGGEYVEKV